MNPLVELDKYMKACYGIDYAVSMINQQRREIEQAFLSGIHVLNRDKEVCKIMERYLRNRGHFEK